MRSHTAPRTPPTGAIHEQVRQDLPLCLDGFLNSGRCLAHRMLRHRAAGIRRRVSWRDRSACHACVEHWKR